MRRASFRPFLPKAAARALDAACSPTPTIVQNGNTFTSTTDFSTCGTGYAGQLVVTIGPASSGADFVMTIAFQNLSLADTGATVAINGTITATGTMTGAGVYTMNLATGTGGVSFTTTLATGASTSFTFNESLSVGIQASGSSATLTESGTFSTTMNGTSYSASIDPSTPLVLDAAVCAYPQSGTIQMTTGGNTMSTTFGPGCGSATVNPGGTVITLQ
jgi:hypothetical protein